ncbi:DnrP protein [Pseudoalteromonas byunsanensis]
MKCKKCKSGITSPIVKTTNVDGTPITSSSCPVCGEHLDSSNKHWIVLVILIIALGVASKYFS